MESRPSRGLYWAVERFFSSNFNHDLRLLFCALAGWRATCDVDEQVPFRSWKERSKNFIFDFGSRSARLSKLCGRYTGSRFVSLEGIVRLVHDYMKSCLTRRLRVSKKRKIWKSWTGLFSSKCAIFRSVHPSFKFIPVAVNLCPNCLTSWDPSHASIGAPLSPQSCLFRVLFLSQPLVGYRRTLEKCTWHVMCDEVNHEFIRRMVLEKV